MGPVITLILTHLMMMALGAAASAWYARRKLAGRMLIGFGAGQVVSRQALDADLAALRELHFTGAQVVDEIELPSGMKLKPAELDTLLHVMYPKES